MAFLPINRQEMQDRGWESCDFVYVIGDAYVDHPSFGHAIISRILESHGYSVGIISQPDWKNPRSIDVFGRPRLGFLVSGGNMDSMVNHYSVTKHRRKNDAFTPGGVMGKRPDYATIVYCNLIRQSYKDVPILIGGIEASLRRLGHYDYWSESMKRSILLDSQADLLMYGMGEKSIVEIADALNAGMEAKDITYIDGTVDNAADEDGNILVALTDQIAVDNGCVVRPFAHNAAGCKCIGFSFVFCDGVVVDHGVHIAAGYQESQTGTAENIDGFGVLPVGLGDDTDAVAVAFQNAADDCVTKRRMIHVGITDHVYKVAAFPATIYHILFANGQKRHILPPTINIFSIITDVAAKGK